MLQPEAKFADMEFFPDANEDSLVTCIRICIGKVNVTDVNTASFLRSYYSANIEIYLSPCHESSLKSLLSELGIFFREDSCSYNQFSQLSDNGYKELDGFAYRAELDLHTDFDKLLTFFKYCNLSIKENSFPNDLLTDLTLLQQRLANNHLTAIPYLCPLAIDSVLEEVEEPEDGDLLDCLLYNSTDEYKSALIKGQSPNQSSFLQTPLKAAILRQDKWRPLELILWYGGNPFSRFQYSAIEGGIGCNFNALEWALAYRQFDKANIIVNAFSRPKKILSNTHKQPDKLIQHTAVYSSMQGVHTSFTLHGHRRIDTLLQPLGGVTKSTKDAIYELFCQNFMIDHDERNVALKKVFEKDFSGNKLIDIISFQEKVIGFNLYDTVNLENRPDHQYIYCAYAAILPAYRHLGLMQILSFRMAYITKCMMPEKNVGFFFFAAHYNSYRMINCKHFPKYQTADSLEDMENLIFKILGPVGNKHYHHHLLTSYITDNTKVKSTTIRDRTIYLDERMFQNEILDLDNSDPAINHDRNATVMFYVNQENLFTMEMTAQIKGLNFLQHIEQYAAKLASWLTYFQNANLNLNANNATFFQPVSNDITISSASRPGHAKL